MFRINKLFILIFVLANCIFVFKIKAAELNAVNYSHDGNALDLEPLTVVAPPGIIRPKTEKLFPSLDVAVLEAGQEEAGFLQLINEYREQNGVPVLAINSYLQTAAQWLSEDMANKNYFSHTDSLGRDAFQRMAEFGYDIATFKGENIAAGYATAVSVMEAWKNSPGHNANMLNSNYHVIGIGLAYEESSNYGWYWTTDFGGVQTDPEYNSGDVNNDGQINIHDIQACVNQILSLQDWGDAADANGDSSVNLLDVQFIVDIILK